MTAGRIGRDVRERVAALFQHRCAYCRSPLFLFPGSQQVDHIVPRALGGTDDEVNLCYCCPRCNQLKSDRTSAQDPVTQRRVELFHPRKQRWARHFAWAREGIRVDALTRTGRATVVALDMNGIDLLNARRVWTLAGWHPPVEHGDHS